MAEEESVQDSIPEFCIQEEVQKELEGIIGTPLEIEEAENEIDTDTNLNQAEEELKQVDRDPDTNPKPDQDDHIKNYTDIRQKCCQLVFISTIASVPKNDKEENSIIKKVETCTDGIITAVEKAGIDVTELGKLIGEIHEKKLVNLTSFSDSNLINFSLVSSQIEDEKLNQKASNFAKYLFRQTPYDFAPKKGSAGVGEFMFCVLDPRIKKPLTKKDYEQYGVSNKKGDLLIPSEKEITVVELKGKSFEISGEIEVKEFKEKMKELIKDIEAPLKELEEDVKKRIIDDCVRLDRYEHKKDFDELFTKMKEQDQENGFQNAKKFIKKWLDITNNGIENKLLIDDKYIDEILLEKDNEIIFNSKMLRKLTALSFLYHYFNVNKFDVLIRLGCEGKADEVYKIKKDTFKKKDPNEDPILKIINPKCKIMEIDSTLFSGDEKKIGFKIK